MPLRPSFLIVAMGVATSAFADPPPSPLPPVWPPSRVVAPRPAVASLEGTVLGPDGRPVKEALVVARTSNPIFPEPLITTRTDAVGFFRLSLRSAGFHAVRVEATGLAPYDGQRIQPGMPLQIRLARGGTIEGTVRDGASKIAVEGAIVEARSDRVHETSAIWEAGAGLIQTKTDRHGRYRLTGLAPGVHTISARSRRF